MTSVELKKLFPGKKVEAVILSETTHHFSLDLMLSHNIMLPCSFQIGKVTETSLSANQERTEMEKKRLVWKKEGLSRGAAVARGQPVDPAKLMVELAPMEIRTFVIDFDQTSHEIVDV